jgi:hypothetical protein
MERSSSRSAGAPTPRLNFGCRVNGDETTRLTAMSDASLTALDQTPPRLTLGRCVVPVEVLQRPRLEEDCSRRVVHLNPARLHWFTASATIHELPLGVALVPAFSFRAPGTDMVSYSAWGSTRRPRSSRWLSAIAVGALVSGSLPDWVLGKAMTSRMFDSPSSSAVRRSIPKAKPA